MTNAGGCISAGPVHCVENHDGALTVWRDAGVTQRVLLHVDAHHDLYGGWIDKKNPKERARINIANFLYAALENELVREVIWVVPNQTWLTPAGRWDIVRELKSLDQGVGRKKPAIQIERDRIIGTVLGRRILACTVENLPALNGAVLLDIDVDYFVISNVDHRGIYACGLFPWCWPDELLMKLQARGIHTDLTTIAYSVEGGYTPLQWKYLGDELAQRLHAAPPDLEWADHMHKAGDSAARGESECCEKSLLTAHSLRPDLAAPCYHLAHLHALLGRVESGREYLRKAIELDPSYRTPYNNAGFGYLARHRHAEAKAAFDRTLTLDPSATYAHVGMGMLAMEKKKWPAAESSLRRAIAIDNRCVDGYRFLGRMLARRREYVAAIDAYERSLTLTLAGERSVTSEVTLCADVLSKSPWDPEHGDVHAELARLLASTGACAEAIAGYRMAIAAGCDNSISWFRLAILYGRTQHWTRAASALYRAATRVPRDLLRWLHRTRIRYRAAFESWTEMRKSNRRLGPRLWT